LGPGSPGVRAESPVRRRRDVHCKPREPRKLIFKALLSRRCA
jgi:hypothetical protein